MEHLKHKTVRGLRWLEKYTKTDMVYAAKGSFWMNLNTILVTLLSFALSIEFAHFLSKTEYGTYQFVFSIATIIGALTLTGMNTAVTQAVARGFEGTLKKSVRVQLMWGIIPFAAGLITSLYYILHSNSTLAVSFVVVAVFLPILSSVNTYTTFFVGKKDFKSGFSYSQAVNAAYYGSMLFALFFVHTATILILINFGVNTIITAILYLSMLKNQKPNDKEDADAISYGKHLSVLNIFSTIALQADNIIVYHFLGAVELAIYAFASTIPEKLNGLVKSISIIALPKFSSQNLHEIKKTILSKTLRLLALALTLSIVYIIFAPYLFKIFFPQYLSSVLYSQWYAVAASLFISSSLPVTALMATRSKKELYVYNIVSPLFQISALIVGGAFYGIWGIIAGKILSGIVMIVASLGLIFFNFQRKENAN